ncbi:MAG: hypothetical protein ACYCPN_01730 [Thermoplasmata archaeon]
MEPTDRSVELTAEKARSSGTVIRLTVRVPAHGDGRRPTADELAEALRQLESELDALVGDREPPVDAVRTDRELNELLLAYRPRQPELIELLRADGEISEAEYQRLRAHLDSHPPVPAPPPAPPSRAPPAPVEAPVAPRAEEPTRPSGAARPVEVLTRTYQIETLKQAGAVRSRREISFEEYMALKRHFEAVTARRASAPAESR